MKRNSVTLRILPDLIVLAGLGLGVVLVLRPAWLGLNIHSAGSIVPHVIPTVTAPAFLFPLVFIAIMWSAIRAAVHAEAIANKLKEPFGTLVLTISAVVIEVALVLGVMISSNGGDTVARDTLFATLMLIMNGLVGIAIIAGALRKREQPFNAQSSSAYLGLIAALCTIGLILPRLTTAEPGGYMTDQMDIFVGGASLGVFIAFITLQSSSHREFFTYSLDGGSSTSAHTHARSRPLWVSASLLILSLVTVVFLAESLGGLLATFLSRRFLPESLQGVAIAFLVLLPEGIAAIRSALGSNVQRTINILHGSALSTIGLTIPLVLLAAGCLGREVELGLEPPEICLLTATIIISILHFGQGKTNMMQGIVHAMFFAIWIAVLMEYDLPNANLP